MSHHAQEVKFRLLGGATGRETTGLPGERSELPISGRGELEARL